MRKHSVRWLDSSSDQERRPIDGVLSQDVFADEVNGGPELVKADCALTLSVSKSNRGDVIGQCVEPNVDRMLRVIGHRNRPANRSFFTAYRKIIQSTPNKADRFITPSVWSDEFTLLIESQQ